MFDFTDKITPFLFSSLKVSSKKTKKSYRYRLFRLFFHIFEQFFCKMRAIIPKFATQTKTIVVMANKDIMALNPKILAFATLLYMATPAAAQSYQVKSPDGKITAELNTDKNLSILFNLNGTQLLKKSEIGLKLQDGKEIGKNPKVKSHKLTRHKETISAPFYRQPSFSTQYQELNVMLKNGFGIILRAYDEGVAYRFYTQRKGKTIILNETAAYQFGKDKKAWLPYTTTPEKPFAMAFQNIYHETLLDTARQELAFLPATIDCRQAKVTLMESDLQSYPGMWVQANSTHQDQQNGTLRAVFAPYPKEMAYYPWRHMSHVKTTQEYIATSNGKRSYPWRIFAITEHDTQMPTNNLVYALAAPNKIGDTSWVKPGKVAWDWWNDWNLKGVDFKAGINYETYRYYIDFAHNYGLEYIVLDEGWYNSREGSILKPIDEIQLPKLIEYARQKGVGIVLWAVFNVMDENLETICKTYADMGIKGFKVDFMDRDDQTAVEMIERLAACTAKHHLILDLHGLYKPVGLNRTYPNILNYESVFGMEECRWTELKNNMPLYDVTFPYIRMMAGQVDFTPGAMRNGTREDWKAIYTKPISMGTRCHQAACYLVQDSPFTMLADSPTNYEADEPYTRYIAQLPVVFDQTIVPQGEMGKYIVTARQKGNDWYLGGQSNWDERTLTLTFDFLPDGDYDAVVLKDGINANHDAEDYKIEKTVINRKSKLDIHLASGGGFVIKLFRK